MNKEAWQRACRVVVRVALVCVTATTEAQAPEPRPPSTMQQLMQGIVFPNANVIFAAQETDPGLVSRVERPSVATDAFRGLYGGWQAIENSGVALAEVAELLNTPGRICASGRPVPVQQAEWKAAVRALRDAGLMAAEVARAQSRERVSDLAEQVTNTCSGCHRLYRQRGNPCVNNASAMTPPRR